MALAAAAGGEALKALVKAPVLLVVLQSLLLTVERGVHELVLLEVPALAERVPVPIAAAQEVFTHGFDALDRSERALDVNSFSDALVGAADRL